MQTTKAIIISTTSALIMGVLLHLILPVILSVLIAGSFSESTTLGSPYTGDRIEAIWEVLGFSLAVQTAKALIFAPLTGALVGYIVIRIRSGWIFLIGPIVGFIVHNSLFVVSFVLTDVFAIEGIRLVLSTGIPRSTVIAPIIGLVSALVIKLFVRESKRVPPEKRQTDNKLV